MLSITATDLPRLMNCNGSRLMGEAEATTQKTDDTVKDEGVAAHWLAQQVRSGKSVVEELIDRKAPNGVYITTEMVEYLEDYIQTISVGGDVEIDTSYSGNEWKVRGRADHIFYDPETKTLNVNDLKYGWSIVEPKTNWTLISHAIAAIALQNPNQVNHVILTVFQPRPYHPAGPVRSEYYSIQQIIDFRSQIINTLTNPTDTLRTNPNCKNCPSLTHCPAARKAQFNAIDASEDAFHDHLTNPELSYQLDLVDRAIEVLKLQQKAYSELAQHRLQKGQIVENYAIKAELTNRQWVNGVTPDYIKMLTGLDLTEPKLKSPAQVEKAGVSKEVVASLTERRQKGFKLVRVDANSNAKKLFNPKT